MAVSTREPKAVTDADLKAAVDSVDEPKTNGTPLSALLSAGVGVFILGVLTTGAVISAGLKNALVVDAFKPVGPLSGKTIYAVAAYIVAWAISYVVMRGKNYEARPFYIATFVLVALGFVATFPLFFDLFGG